MTPSTFIINVIINGKHHILPIAKHGGAVISYEKILRLANKPIGATVTITYRYGKESGTLLPSRPITVPVDESPIFNVAWTGDA